MECGICLESFNAAARLPKSLPCGHTYCLACLKQLRDKKCPQDEKAFSGDPSKLPTTFVLLQMISSASTASGSGRAERRFWCRDCCCVAAEACLETHTVTSAAPALRGRLQALAALAAEQAEQLEQPQHLDQALQVLLGPAASGSVAFKDKHCEWQVELQLPAASAAAPRRDSADLLRYNVLALLAASWPKSEAAGDSAGSKALPGPAGSAPAVCVERPALGEVGEALDMALLTDGQREALLHSSQLKGVRRLVGLRGDMLGCLQLLQLVAPHLEELQLHDCRGPQLREVLSMPRLHRLELWNCSDDLWRNPFSLPPSEDKPALSQETQQQHQALQQQLQQLQQQLQQHQMVNQVQQLEQELQRKLREQELQEQRQQRLKWLRIGNLPYGLTISLIMEHRDSLEELWLLAGTGGSLPWPNSCPGGSFFSFVNRLKVVKTVTLMRAGVWHVSKCPSCTSSTQTSACYSTASFCCSKLLNMAGNNLSGTKINMTCDFCSNVKVQPF